MADTSERRGRSAFAETSPRRADSGTADLANHFEQATFPLLPSLHAVARVLTNDASEAEDLVVEAYARVYRTFRVMGGSQPLKVWMLRMLIAGFSSRTSRRSPSSLATPAQSGGHGDQVGSDLPGMTSSALRDAVEAASCADVDAALASIPTAFRLTLWLVDGEGLTYGDVASLLDVPTGTVASLVRLARTAFRERLLLRAGKHGGPGG